MVEANQADPLSKSRDRQGVLEAQLVGVLSRLSDLELRGDLDDVELAQHRADAELRRSVIVAELVEVGGDPSEVAAKFARSRNFR